MLGRLALLLALTTTASAYPVSVPSRPASVRATREAAFAKRNPQHILTVESDEHGFISHVRTDDPSLVPATITNNAWPSTEHAQLRAFLDANADLFGFPPATADRLPASPADLLLVDDFEGALLGEIAVRYEPGPKPILDIQVMYWLDVKPTLTPAGVAKRIVGRRYTETIGYAKAPQRDCAMSDGGRANCKTRVTHQRTRKVKIAATDLMTSAMVLRKGNKVRLVACSEILTFDDPDPAPSWGAVYPSQRAFTPIAGAPPLPLVVDLVTGDVIATKVGCGDPDFSDER